MKMSYRPRFFSSVVIRILSIVYIVSVLLPFASFADGVLVFHEKEGWALHIDNGKRCIPSEFKSERIRSSDAVLTTSGSFPNRITVQWGQVLDETFVLELGGTFVVREAGNLQEYRFLDLVIEEKFGFDFFEVVVEVPEVGLILIGSTQDEATSIAARIFSDDSCENKR